jgi:hypothetical protein
MNALRHLSTAAQAVALANRQDVVGDAVLFLSSADVEYELTITELFLKSLDPAPDNVTKAAVDGLCDSMRRLEDHAAALYSLMNDRLRSVWGWRSLWYDSAIKRQLEATRAARRQFESRSLLLCRVMKMKTPTTTPTPPQETCPRES